MPSTSSDTPSTPATEADVTPTALPVTLTSVQDSSDRRFLTLVSGKPCLIGRASKSEVKNLQPTSTNALFDCPVVSREHAELKANPWAANLDQVTITDKGSMHGTRVNGQTLKQGLPKSLRSGDLIQFGDRVTRADGTPKFLLDLSLGPFYTDGSDTDTHEGVVVFFGRTENDLQSSDTLAASQPSKFEVPYASDNESDAPSDDEYSIISDVGDHHKGSSAKTTPALSKATPGSADQPIDVEAMPPPTRLPMIDLIRSDTSRRARVVRDHGAYTTSQPAVAFSPVGEKENASRFSDPVRVVQNSIDRHADIIVPESIPTGPRAIIAGRHVLVSESEDVDSVYDHNTGLTGILHDGPDTSSERGEEDEDSQNDEFDYPIEEEEEEEVDEDASDASVSDRDDFSRYGAVYGDASDDEEPEIQSSKKQASPELGSQGFATAAPAATEPPKITPFNRFDEVIRVPSPPTAAQRHYDPVRGSQPPRSSFVPKPFGMSNFFDVPIKPTPSSNYTYGPMHSNPMSSNAATDLFSSTRWDVPPPLPCHNSDFAPRARGPTRDDFTNPNIPFQPWDKAFDARAPPMGYPPRIDGSQPFGFDHSWDSAPPPPPPEMMYNYSSAFPPPPSKVSKVVPSMAPLVPKKKISIPDIVEGTSRASLPAADEVPKKSSPTGSKRKADEISTSSDFDAALNSLCNPQRTGSQLTRAQLDDPLDGVPSDRDDLFDEVFAHEWTALEEPPARRRKTNGGAARAVTEVAKFAGYTTLGGVGVVAFLCSPLAERLTQWLS